MQNFLRRSSLFVALVLLAFTAMPQAYAVPSLCDDVCGGDLNLAGPTGPCDGTNDYCYCYQPECYGTDGDDIMCGDETTQVFHGGAGDDIICAGDGEDTLHGGFGNDCLFGEGDDDELRGGHCADILDGGADSDFCKGGWGVDNGSLCEPYMEGKDSDHPSQSDDCTYKGTASWDCDDLLPPD